MSIGGYQNWSNISDGRYKENIRENVPGLEFISLLKPVTYTVDINGISKFLGEDIKGGDVRTNAEGNPIFQKEDEEGHQLTQQGRDEKSKIMYTGFIAQDVEAAASKVGYDFSGVDKPQNEHTLYGLRYAEFVVPLVKAVQDLDEENRKMKIENSELKSANDEQQKEIDQLKSEIASIKFSIGNSKFEMTDNFAKLACPDFIGETFPNGSLRENQKLETGFLGQNIPNPFDNSTIIPFRIPQDCNDALIVITEQSTGRIVRAIPVNYHETQLTIEAGTLAGGTYCMLMEELLIPSRWF